MKCAQIHICIKSRRGLIVDLYIGCGRNEKSASYLELKMTNGIF